MSASVLRPGPVMRVVAIALLLCAPLAGFAATALQPAAIALDGLAATYDGLAHAVTAAVTPAEGGPYVVKITYAGKTAAPINAGGYAVKVVATSPTHTGVATGTLVIAKAPLAVAALDQSRLFGSANPALTLSYSGFLAGQTASVLNVKPTVATTAKTSSAAGEYPITVTGGSDNNYDITTRTPGVLTVVPPCPGTYESLLYDFTEASVPVGKLTLTLPARGTAFTGSLNLANESAAIALSGKLAPTPDLLGAQATVLRTRGNGSAYTVQFTVNADGLVATLLHREDATSESTSFREVGPAALLRSYTAADPAPWRGAYTLALLDPAPTFGFDSYPAGLAHASGTVAANGSFPLSGRLSDGTLFTATVKPDADGGHRLFVRPYGTRLSSYLSGELLLRPHPDADRAGRYYIPAGISDSLYWKKAARSTTPLDALYPDGFGPLDLVVALDPWLPPVAAKAATKTLPASPAITLAQRLGLAADELADGIATVSYGVEYYGDKDADLPLVATVTTKNKILPVLAAPPANPLGWTLSVTTATGRFSGGFTLKDTVAAPTTANPDATRSVSRTIKIYGVLRQPPLGDDTTLGAGYLLLPALPGAFDPATVSAEFRLRSGVD